MKIKFGRIMVPFFYYITVRLVVEILVFGSGWFGEAAVLWNILFGALAAVPGLWYFYRQDRVYRGDVRWNWKLAFVLAAVGAVVSGVSRIVIEKAGMLDYGAVEEVLLAGDLWLQLLVLVGASPVLEEFVFRGVLYGRLKEFGSAKLAMAVSALLFGLYHGNVSQGIYGFFMGLFLAWTMEYCQTVKAPIAVHAAANLMVLCMKIG